MSASRISPELLETIKSKLNLVDIVGEHVVLRKSGNHYSGLCPFHNERSPSFTVSEQKQLYHCHGCKAGGDLLKFVMELNGLTFPEAVKELAERAGVQLPKFAVQGETAESKEMRERKETAYRLNRFAAAFFRAELAKSPQARAYLAKRGVSEDLEREFYVGWAPNAWESLAQHLSKSKAPLQLAEQLGLIRPSQKQSGHFDLFRNRIIFPILDVRGRILAFGGRLLPGQDSDDGPKYLNSAESFLFRKSNVIYGLHSAKKHMREANEAILVEGYFDVLGLCKAGIHHVGATCGTALTPEHLKALTRFSEKITLLYDGDAAGRNATDRAMEIGLQQGLVLYGAFLPQNVDPDELALREGGTAQLKSLIEAGRPLLDLKMEELFARAAQGPEEKTQSIKELARLFGLFKDPIGKEVRIEGTARALGISRNLLDPKTPSPRTPAAPRIEVRPAQRPARPVPNRRLPAFSRHERFLLESLAFWDRFGSFWMDVYSQLPPNGQWTDFFEHPLSKDFTDALFTRGQSGPEIPETQAQMESRFRECFADARWSSENHQVQSIITEALVRGTPPLADQELKGLLGRRLVRVWARFSQSLRAAIGQAEKLKQLDQQSQLMKDYLDVQRKMKEFNNFYAQDENERTQDSSSQDTSALKSPQTKTW